MYARFTERAMKVMQHASDEAHRLNHEYIDTEHILLALTRVNGGLLPRIFKHLHLDPKLLEQEVEGKMSAGPDMVTIGKLPLTPYAKKVLEYTNEETSASGFVGPEHLLLGLILQAKGVAALVLKNAGVQIETVRSLISNLPPEAPAAPPSINALPFSVQLPLHTLCLLVLLRDRLRHNSLEDVIAEAVRSYANHCGIPPDWEQSEKLVSPLRALLNQPEITDQQVRDVLNAQSLT